MSILQYPQPNLAASTAAAFHAVVCDWNLSSGVNRTAELREVWRLVRPGEKLAISISGPTHLEPASTWFWDAIRKIRPDLYSEFYPRDSIGPQALRTLLSEAGIANSKVVVEAGAQPVSSPDAWWTVLTSLDYGRIVEQLDAADRAYVRSATWHNIHYSGITSVDVNVYHVEATKPPLEEFAILAGLQLGGQGLTEQPARLFV
jgi:hypothetical protein